MSLRWRLDAPLLGVVNGHYLKSKPLIKRWARKGITIEQETTDSESSGCEIQTIRIQATSQMSGAVIQCAAISTRNSASSSYSKFAILEVEALPEVAVAESSAGDQTTTTATPPK